jgi:hypothetical protein
MALTAKMLWLQKIGSGGQSAYVMVGNDAPVGYRLNYVDGIPARYPPAMAWDWIKANYTSQYGWDHGRELVGRELEIWLALWNASTVHNDIATGVTACNNNITAVANLTTLAGAKPILTAILNILINILVVLDRLISVTEWLVRTQTPTPEQSAGGDTYT